MEYIEYSKDLPEENFRVKNIFIDAESNVADGVLIGCNVYIVGSKIGRGCVINSNTIINSSVIFEETSVYSSQITDSEIGCKCKIGPFAHIRNNAKLGDNIRVGNFVEIKNSIIGEGSKMAHLSYIGDAIIGTGCNIGCGVVFCNYNGKIKQATVVGNNVFIGSNANLIAPIKIADKAYIGAGSTINRDVGEGELAIARERQYNTKNFKNPFLDDKNQY